MDTKLEQTSISPDSSSVDELRQLEVNEKSLLRKIDWRLVPIMFVVYVLQFLDKVVINYANVMGIQSDLHMTGNDFSWLATAFFTGYAVAELPQAYLLQRFPAARVLGIEVFFWGVLVCCCAACTTYTSLLALRTLLGILESVIAPALTIITSAWYTKKESTPRFGLWYCSVGIGQIIGGLISFGAQHAPANSFAGWRIMFLCVGFVNMLVSLLVFFLLPSTPQTGRFLTTPELHHLTHRLTLDLAGLGPKTFHRSIVTQTLLDTQLHLLCLLILLTAIPSGVITTYSSILIKNFGYTTKQAALLNMPSGLVSLAATLLSTYSITHGYHRTIAIAILLLPTLLGAGLMSFLPTSNQAGCLVGIYLINCTIPTLILVLALIAANFATHTGKVTASTAVSAAFSVGCIIGPQTFRDGDAPQYYPAKITVMAVNAAGIVVYAISLLRLAEEDSGKNRSSLVHHRPGENA
ncbi:allantoate permease [Saccharata proteae CBS 121410]|uniref:Allantoate permease n=1 Tax=Saccharata proteae CBS 121410 TaxID=1314787 RepID=A0A9P4HVJ9_9PEZI|nr:allantoate permease [Saccharata proteae CBS 121410]